VTPHSLPYRAGGEDDRKARVQKAAASTRGKTKKWVADRLQKVRAKFDKVDNPEHWSTGDAQLAKDHGVSKRTIRRDRLNILGQRRRRRPKPLVS
jgi:hypothetical protein